MSTQSNELLNGLVYSNSCFYSVHHKHCVSHKHCVAEIMHNYYLTVGQPYSSKLNSLADVKRGVFERYMPGVEKWGREGWYWCNQPQQPQAGSATPEAK